MVLGHHPTSDGGVIIRMCVCGRTFGRSVQKQHEGRGGTDARAGDRRWADRTSYGTVVSVDTMVETAGRWQPPAANM